MTFIVKIPPKIDIVVILGCMLMGDFDFQPHCGLPTFTPKLGVIDTSVC